MRQEAIKSEIIRTIVDFLKDSKTVNAMFKKYNTPIDDIDNVEILFSNIPVSAKTKDKVIYINEAFLEDGAFAEELHYFVHELTHWLQQHCGDPFDLIGRSGEFYLDMLTEIEAFCFQVKFIREFYGDEKAEEYVNNLLDFHGLKGKEREKRKEIFLSI